MKDSYQAPGTYPIRPLVRLAIIFSVVLAGAMFILIRCSSPSADMVTTTTEAPKGSAAVYARVNSLTDCDALQAEFDPAAENHDLQSQEGVQMIEISSSYTEAADDRMRETGCY